LFTYNLVLLLVMPLSFWIGAVHWQTTGVAAAWVVVYPLLMVWLVRETLREVGLSWMRLARHLWPPFVATLVMAALMTPVLWATAAWAGPLLVVRLALAGLVGAATYVAILVRFYHPATQDIRELIGWIFGGGRAVAWNRAR
jgi:hypothetical protein